MTRLLLPPPRNMRSWYTQNLFPSRAIVVQENLSHKTPLTLLTSPTAVPHLTSRRKLISIRLARHSGGVVYNPCSKTTTAQKYCSPAVPGCFMLLYFRSNLSWSVKYSVCVCLFTRIMYFDMRTWKVYSRELYFFLPDRHGTFRKLFPNTKAKIIYMNLWTVSLLRTWQSWLEHVVPKRLIW